MASIDMIRTRKLVKEVLEEFHLPLSREKEKGKMMSGNDGPKVLIVFHAGVSKLGEAMKQVQSIQRLAGKSSVFTDESARSWVCGEDVRKQTGTRCILDTVRPEGLGKVLERADVLVLPTFCLKVGAKVANVILDDQAPGMVFSALAQGKKVLASRDGFLIHETLSNMRIREEIDRILEKLEGFGIVFVPTDQLSARFQEIVLHPRASGDHREKKSPAPGDEGLRRIVTAKDINNAANAKKGTVRVVKGGVVTPLARDLAKEYGIKIIEGE